MENFVRLEGHTAILIESLLDNRYDLNVLVQLPIFVKEINQIRSLLHEILRVLVVEAS